MLRDSPRDVRLPEPEVHHGNVFGTSGAESRPDGVRALLGAYSASTGFWLVCLLSAALTLIREAFNAWVPVYLVDVHQVDSSTAARYSAVFPLLGGVSSLLVGALGDRVAADNRVLVMIPAMGLCAASSGGEREARPLPGSSIRPGTRAERSVARPSVGW